MRNLTMVLILTMLVSSLMLGCDFLLPGDGEPGFGNLFKAPKVELQQAALTEYPGVSELGAWYCPELIGGGGAIACDLLLGPAPYEEDMQFLFQVGIEVENPNSYPLPAVELLVSLTLFPAAPDHPPP